MTIRLQGERERRGLSKQKLGFESHVAPQIIGLAENGRRTPYPVEIARIAEALDFAGDPAALLEEVEG